MDFDCFVFCLCIYLYNDLFGFGYYFFLYNGLVYDSLDFFCEILDLSNYYVYLCKLVLYIVGFFIIWKIVLIFEFYKIIVLF